MWTWVRKYIEYTFTCVCLLLLVCKSMEYIFYRITKPLSHISNCLFLWFLNLILSVCVVFVLSLSGRRWTWYSSYFSLIFYFCVLGKNWLNSQENLLELTHEGQPFWSIKCSYFFFPRTKYGWLEFDLTLNLDWRIDKACRVYGATDGRRLTHTDRCTCESVAPNHRSEASWAMRCLPGLALFRPCVYSNNFRQRFHVHWTLLVITIELSLW